MNGKALQMNCRDMPSACFKCHQLIYASPNMPKACPYVMTVSSLVNHSFFPFRGGKLVISYNLKSRSRDL